MGLNVELRDKPAVSNGNVGTYQYVLQHKAQLEIHPVSRCPVRRSVARSQDLPDVN
jgi:hypothetical protein